MKFRKFYILYISHPLYFSLIKRVSTIMYIYMVVGGSIPGLYSPRVSPDL